MGLLGVLAGREYGQDEFLGSWAGLLAALLAGAPVTGDPVAPVEALDGVRSDAHVELLFDQRMGHRVIVAVHRHVVVDVYSGLLPLGYT